MTLKTLPERRGLVEGPFLYAQWWHNFCPRCGLEIGAYYIHHGTYPAKRDLCLKCADSLEIDRQQLAC